MKLIPLFPLAGISCCRDSVQENIFSLLYTAHWQFCLAEVPLRLIFGLEYSTVTGESPWTFVKL